MEDAVLAGDVTAGDVITLPGSNATVQVQVVRLGQGGFILTVRPAGDPRPEAESAVTLTAQTRVRRHRRVPTG